MPSHEYYMSLALAVSKGSKCKKKQVGSVIVDKEGRVVSLGFNGTPRGSEFPSESFQPEGTFTNPWVLHSELNAVIFAKRDITGCKLYVTLSPCLSCAAIIVQTGITEVYYQEKYRDITGISFLRDHGILCLQL